MNACDDIIDHVNDCEKGKVEHKATDVEDYDFVYKQEKEEKIINSYLIFDKLQIALANALECGEDNGYSFLCEDVTKYLYRYGLTLNESRKNLIKLKEELAKQEEKEEREKESKKS